MDFLKSVTGKVLTGVVALAVIAAGISWWQMDPATRSSLLGGTGRITGWFLVILLVPWAMFFVIGAVGRLESNLYSGLFILALTGIEAAALAWLFDWSIRGGVAWTFFLLGALFAGVYNLFICDWIAERVG